MTFHTVNHIHSRKKRKRIEYLDKFLIVLAIVAPIVSLLHVYEIYSTQSAAGVSIITWTFYFVTAIPWLVYGFVHDAKPIIIAYTLWLVVDALVILAALAYS